MRYRITFYLAHPNSKPTEEGYQMCDTNAEAESLGESWEIRQPDGYYWVEEVIG